MGIRPLKMFTSFSAGILSSKIGPHYERVKALMLFKPENINPLTAAAAYIRVFIFS